MASLISRIRSLPHSVWLLGTISLLNDSASEMIYPLLPLFLVGTLGAGPRVLGLIEGLAEAVSSLLKLVAGVWSDRMRRAKPFVVTGYGIAGIARTLIAAATGWWMVLACRLADRVGKGLRSSPRDAMLGRSIAPEQRGLAFGLHRAMDNAGAVIGPLVAVGLLALGMELRTVFWVAGIPAVIVLLLTLRLRESEAAVVVEPVRFSWKLQGFPPAFKRYLLVLGLFMLGNSSNLFLLLRVRELGFAQAQIPLLWALMSLVAAVFLTP
jgi:nitrate/nitrite transporter NarK